MLHKIENIDEVDCVDKHGRTVLYLAALSGNVEVLEILLSHGFKPTVQSFEGVPVISAASQRGHAAAVVHLARHTKKGSFSFFFLKINIIIFP